MKPIAMLVICSLALWGLLLIPGSIWWGGWDAVQLSGAALALVLLPAVLTLFAAVHWGSGSHETFFAFAMGGTMVRMVVTLGVVFVLTTQVQEEWVGRFVWWVTGFYLFVLGLEVTLLVKQPKGDEPG